MLRDTNRIYMCYARYIRLHSSKCKKYEERLCGTTRAAAHRKKRSCVTYSVEVVETCLVYIVKVVYRLALTKCSGKAKQKKGFRRWQL